MIIAVLCVAIVIRDIVVEEMDRSAARKAKKEAEEKAEQEKAEATENTDGEEQNK